MHALPASKGSKVSVVCTPSVSKIFKNKIQFVLLNSVYALYRVITFKSGQAFPLLTNYTCNEFMNGKMISFVSLACVSSETHDQQRVFRPRGASPLFKLYRYVPRQRVCFFQSFWSEIGYQFRPFWSEIGYGLCTLVLNWVFLLEELANSSSFGDKTISL